MYTAKITISMKRKKLNLFSFPLDKEYNRYINSNLQALRKETRQISRFLSKNDNYIVTAEVLDKNRERWINPEVFENGYQTY